MIGALLLVIALVIGAVPIVRWLSVRTEDGNLPPFPVMLLVRAGVLVVVAIFLSILFDGSVGQVPAGHRGVVTQFGAVTGEVKNEGLFFVVPGVQKVVLMDVQVHADKSKATAASHDLQNVATEVTVNYRVDAKQVAKVYQDLRTDYVARVMGPAIQEAVKSATAQFNAENLIIERPRVKDTIEEFLQQRLTQHGLIVDGIAITDFQFSPDFANAIEAKVTSQQLALKAKNDVEIVHNQQLTKYEIARADSYQTVTNAKATAEAIRIQAQAIQTQGGKDYVNLKAIEKWDGAMPQWVVPGGAMPFVSMAAPGKGK